MKAYPRQAPGLRTRIAGIAAGFAAMLAPGAASAQRVAPSAAPMEWVRYAEASASMISAWLQEEEGAPPRVRAYLNEARGADHAPVEVEASLWLSSDGKVERLHFSSISNAQVNSDLQEAILGRRLSAPPPGMLLPMRIAIRIEPDAEVDGAIQ
jgi:hypothetical protein